MIRLALIALLLAGCDQKPDTTAYDNMRRDVEANDTAAKVDELQNKVADLDMRLKTEEVSSGELFKETTALSSHDSWQDDSTKRLFSNDRILATRTGLPIQNAE